MLAAVPAGAEAAFPGRNGELAYHGSAGGVLYVRGADGDGLRRVRVPGRPADPAYSPLGRRIAFASNGAIWVMNAEGTDVRRLTPPGLWSRSPAWAPDGAAITFAGGAEGTRDLYRIALDGSDLRRLTSTVGDEDAPAWSPRGGRIAFARRGDIHTIGANGAQPRRLTYGRHVDDAPAWSPGGTRIVFTRAWRPAPERRKSRRRSRPGTDAARRGAVQRRETRRERIRRRPQLYAMRRSGARKRRLTLLPYGVTAPAWSPDGREIAFGSGRPGERALHRLRIRNDRVRKLTSGATDVRSLSWQPEVADPVIAAAGDVACDPMSTAFGGGLGTEDLCHQRHTSDLLMKMDLWAVLVLGDVQYEDGQLWKYGQSFHPTWGRVKSLIRPALGNHEYGEGGLEGYFDYFNGPARADGPAGPRPDGYYSFDVGSWHIIALNSQCTRFANAPACAAGSPQERWLRADLAAHRNACTLAFWHHPLISSRLGVDEEVRPLWQALYDADVDVVVTAHDHRYERFAPLDAAGNRDPVRGIRQFVVGTGGKSHQRTRTVLPNSESRNQNTYGVLQLRLSEHGYYWTFVPEAGRRFTDAGANACH
jgi:acid phosphatase type 7